MSGRVGGNFETENGHFFTGRISGTRKDQQGVKTPPFGAISLLADDINVGKVLPVAWSVEGLPCRRELKRRKSAIY
jgi:hypothetical protein